VGRHKVLRATLEGQDIAAIVGEDTEIPAEPHVLFDPDGINIYADSWRVEMGRADVARAENGHRGKGG
jgi:glycerol transport system ATP-binding protein